MYRTVLKLRIAAACGAHVQFTSCKDAPSVKPVGWLLMADG